MNLLLVVLLTVLIGAALGLLTAYMIVAVLGG